MAQLSLIRFGTYAIVTIAVLLAVRQHYVIPLRLPVSMIDGSPWTDPAVYYRGGGAPTTIPGFADTRLSGVEITRITSECLRKEQIDSTKLSWLRINLATRDKKLVWLVTWDLISDPAPVTRIFGS
ncbi:MAG TPA: hypothetical protein VG838_15705 [Opitutaceae bacterium]|nr:hypothetical protein [Opitutaceae bacterium]